MNKLPEDLPEEAKKMVSAMREAWHLAECLTLLRSDLISAGVIDNGTPPMMMTEAVLGALADAVRAEREACADICEQRFKTSWAAQECAEAIRARGRQ